MNSKRIGKIGEVSIYFNPEHNSETISVVRKGKDGDGKLIYMPFRLVTTPEGKESEGIPLDEIEHTPSPPVNKFSQINYLMGNSTHMSVYKEFLLKLEEKSEVEYNEALKRYSIDLAEYEKNMSGVDIMCQKWLGMTVEDIIQFKQTRYDDLQEKYKAQFEVSGIKCICCEKPIKPMEYDRITKNTKAEQWMYHDAVVDMMYAGYGSSHDTSKFLIGICDSCVDLKIKNNIIKDND